MTVILSIASRYLTTPKNERFSIMSLHAVALASFSRTEVFKNPCSEVRQGRPLNGGSVCSLAGGWGSRFKKQLLVFSGPSKLFLYADGVNLGNTVPILEVREEKADCFYSRKVSNCQWVFFCCCYGSVLCFPCASVVVFP